VTAPLERDEGRDIYEIRDDLEETIWEYVGVVRDGERLADGIQRLRRLREALSSVAVGGTRRYNLTWQQWMDVENLALAAEMVARSARYRTESRGAHYREDYPERNDEEWLSNVCVQRSEDGVEVWDDPVTFTRMTVRERRSPRTENRPLTTDQSRWSQEGPVLQWRATRGRRSSRPRRLPKSLIRPVHE